MKGSRKTTAVGVLLGAALVLAGSPAAADKGPIIAVFNIEAKGVRLDRATLDRFSDYLATSLAASGRYRVVPRSQLKKRLIKQKRESYRRCFDQSCQIEIGKELAAQKSTSAQIMRLGSRCVVSVTLYDLRTAATEAAATSKGSCSEDGIVSTLDRVVRDLVRGTGGRARPRPHVRYRRPRPRPEPKPEEETRLAREEPGKAPEGGVAQQTGLLRPSTRGTWLTVGLGPAIGVTEGMPTLFDLSIQVGFHLKGRASGFGFGLLMEIMPGDAGTAYEFGGMVVWDIQPLERYGFYITPGVAFGYFGFTPKDDGSEPSSPTVSVATKGMTLHAMVELKLFLADRGMIFLRAAGMDLILASSSSSSSSTAIWFKALAGGGITF